MEKLKSRRFQAGSIEHPKRYDSFVKAMGKLSPELLEKDPETPEEIYKYYACLDELFVWIKNAYNDNLCVLCNEMRAILGHLAEYDLKDDNIKNLGKAYGHFRRLSIDTFKILCNGFDQVFDEWINKHAIFDYRNVDSDFLPEYVKLFNEAHDSYIDVQKSENLGSDRGNRIIEKYYDVACNYQKLYQYHNCERRRQIEKCAKWALIRKKIWVICTVILASLSIMELFL